MITSSDVALPTPDERDLSLRSRLLLRAGGLLALPVPRYDHIMEIGLSVMPVTAGDALIPQRPWIHS